MVCVWPTVCVYDFVGNENEKNYNSNRVKLFFFSSKYEFTWTTIAVNFYDEGESPLFFSVTVSIVFICYKLRLAILFNFFFISSLFFFFFPFLATAVCAMCGVFF